MKDSHCEAGQTLAVRQRNTGPPVFVSAGNQNISTLVPFLPGAGGRSSKLPLIVHAAMTRPCPPVTSNPLGIQLPASLLRQPDSDERNLLAAGMVKRSRDGENGMSCQGVPVSGLAPAMRDAIDCVMEVSAARRLCFSGLSGPFFGGTRGIPGDTHRPLCDWCDPLPVDSASFLT